LLRAPALVHRNVLARVAKRTGKTSSRSATSRTFVFRQTEWAFAATRSASRFLSYIQSSTARRPALHGRATVPVLWDKEGLQIVNNESADIIRSSIVSFVNIKRFTDYYPEALAAERSESPTGYRLQQRVYRAGFATSQTAYGRCRAAVIRIARLVEVACRDSCSLSASADGGGGELALVQTLGAFDAVLLRPLKMQLRARVQRVPPCGMTQREHYRLGKRPLSSMNTRCILRQATGTYTRGDIPRGTSSTFKSATAGACTLAMATALAGPSQAAGRRPGLTSGAWRARWLVGWPRPRGCGSLGKSLIMPRLKAGRFGGFALDTRPPDRLQLPGGSSVAPRVDEVGFDGGQDVHVGPFRRQLHESHGPWADDCNMASPPGQNRARNHSRGSVRSGRGWRLHRVNKQSAEITDAHSQPATVDVNFVALS